MRSPPPTAAGEALPLPCSRRPRRGGKRGLCGREGGVPTAPSSVESVGPALGSEPPGLGPSVRTCLACGCLSSCQLPKSPLKPWHEAFPSSGPLPHRETRRQVWAQPRGREGAAPACRPVGPVPLSSCRRGPFSRTLGVRTGQQCQEETNGHHLNSLTPTGRGSGLWAACAGPPRPRGQCPGIAGRGIAVQAAGPSRIPLGAQWAPTSWSPRGNHWGAIAPQPNVLLCSHRAASALAWPPRLLGLLFTCVRLHSLLRPPPAPQRRPCVLATGALCMCTEGGDSCVPWL